MRVTIGNKGKFLQTAICNVQRALSQESLLMDMDKTVELKFLLCFYASSDVTTS